MLCMLYISPQLIYITKITVRENFLKPGIWPLILSSPVKLRTGARPTTQLDTTDNGGPLWMHETIALHLALRL